MAIKAAICRGDVLIMMLSDDVAVEGVVFGDGGALQALRRGAIHISMKRTTLHELFGIGEKARGMCAERDKLAAPCCTAPTQRMKPKMGYGRVSTDFGQDPIT